MKHLDNTQKQKKPHMMKSLLNLVEDFTRRQEKKNTNACEQYGQK
jgi:hypothetical protein